LMSLKLWKIAASSLCCFKNELSRGKENQSIYIQYSELVFSQI
jgi:hypothetical protein